MTCFLFILWAYKKPTLFVFVPGPYRAHALSRHINAWSPKIEVRAFPRYRPFKEAVQSQRPDGILLLPVSLMDIPRGYSITLIGSKNGKVSQPYALLGYHRPPKTIGVIRVLPRRVLPMFLENKLGFRPSIKTVSHTENLLALLQFNYVDAVFIPESQTPELTERTRLPLIVHPTEASLELPIMLTLNSNADLVGTVLEWPASINGLVGVSTWVAP